MYRLVFLILTVVCIGCRSGKQPATAPAPGTVIYLATDSAGNITNPEALKYLDEIGERAYKHADRFILHSYTEQQATPGKDKELAAEQAYIAKQYMLRKYERVYYNVGVDVRGFEKPVDAANPTSLTNRRIEVEYLP
jgi:outer membrane protein OmpA-like peptidoglycan-associated protein